MSAENAEGASWRLDNDVWSQQGQRFELEALDGTAVPFGLNDLDYLAGARQARGLQGFLPRQFSYSPFDGKRLSDASVQAWLPPCASSQGNRVCDGQSGQVLAALIRRLTTHWRDNAISMQAAAERIEPPASNGLLYFATDAGGYRDALFALGRGGTLWLWVRNGGHWLQLRAKGIPLAHHRFDHGACAVATLPTARGSGIVVAGDSGVDFLRIDPVRLAYDIDRCEGRALGSPGRLGEYVMAPLWIGGRLQVAVRGDGRWTTLPVEGQLPDDTALLAAPVTTPNGRGLTWIGEHGWLELREQGDAFIAWWHAWPPGLLARPQLGPPYRNGDGDWQLLQRADKSTVSMLVGAPLPREHDLRRASAGTGNSTFQFNVKVDRPWSDYDPDDHPDASDHVIHPFLEVPNSVLLYLRAPNTRRASLLQFYESTNQQEVEYCLGWPASAAQSYTTDAAEPWNAQWFVHDEALWLWIDDRGTLLRWRTK